MARWIRLAMVAVVGVLLLGTRIARSHVEARWRRDGFTATMLKTSARRPGMQVAVPELINGHFAPPVGATSCQPWTGRDSYGRLESVGGYDCFESVNYLITGDASRCVYRSWAREELKEPESAAAWNAFEESLRVGDVVEFVATERSASGVVTTSPFHAQLCIGAGGVMYGANNTPAFDVVRGVPTIVKHWDVCRPEDYYYALRSMDGAWGMCGYTQRYRVVVYRRP
ncbi:MAG TPA: hypothetical protein VH253_16330 [Phycisphaerae bacterium]|nr:hypothetical protein [Phycisphaerae bacterium]